MKNLADFEVVLGVSGGIAAYKAAVLCSMLVKAQARVTVAMTANAARFVAPLTFGALTNRPVYTDLWGRETTYEADHVALAERADLIVVAPATANIIGKMAAGICDDLLSTVLCAAEAGILLAPAMNHRMWRSPAVIRNVATLTEWGVDFIGPEQGRLACGEEGMGRMSEPADICKRIGGILAGQTPKRRSE